MKSFLRTAAAGLIACAAAVAGAAVPVAAQPAGNVVVFGDSFTSNPDQYRNSAFNLAGSSQLSSGSSERLSAGQNTCGRDGDRWVAGLIDTTTPVYNMALHPSRAGSAFVAQQVAGAL